MFRVYDKVREQLVKHKDAWETALRERRGVDVRELDRRKQTVYRVEFELHRKRLREYNLTSLFKLTDATMKSVWQSLCSEYSLRRRTNTRNTNSAELPLWESAREAAASTPAAQRDELPVSADDANMLAQAFGCFASFVRTKLRDLTNAAADISKTDRVKAATGLLEFFTDYLDEKYSDERVKFPRERLRQFRPHLDKIFRFGQGNINKSEAPF